MWVWRFINLREGGMMGSREEVTKEPEQGRALSAHALLRL